MLYDIDTIHLKAMRLYESGEFFKSYINAESMFPYKIALKKPTQKEVRLHFATLVDEVQALEKLHCAVEYREFDFKGIGVQRLPIAVVFETQEEFLHFVRKKGEFRAFVQAYEQATQRFADLKELFLSKPKILLQNIEILKQLLDIVVFFLSNPHPNIYVRELSIIGVDTKFIQKHKAVIDLFLSTVLPKEHYDNSVTKLSENGFEKRYGLKYELPLVRFRILDEALYISSLSDFSLTIEEFEQLDLSSQKIFIVENKITMLSFPPLRDAIVIFGSGYKVGVLKSVQWIRDKEIYYWGDIDMDGFAILSQVRGYFPQVQSFCMDSKTLEQFLDLAVVTQDKNYKELANLTSSERVLYERLFSDYYGKNIRLEQERIPFSYFLKELDAIR